MTCKLVYTDGNTVKVLRGKLISEDSIFVSFETIDGNLFRINKTKITSIKEVAKNDQGLQKM